jgi:hypothetical protein
MTTQQQTDLTAWLTHQDQPLPESLKMAFVERALLIHYTFETVCNRWLAGLKPMFDREPVKVLEELTDIISNINN